MADDRLFSIQKFNGTNWGSWSDNLRNVLAIKEPDAWNMILNGVPVTGTPPAISAVDAKMGAKALGFIYLTCEVAIQSELSGVTCPKVAYDKLKNTYQSSLTVRLFQLEEQWDNLEKAPKESLDQYYARITNLRLQLQDAGIKKSELSVVNTMLRGLPKAYNTLKTVILNLDTTALTMAGVRQFLT